MSSFLISEACINVSEIMNFYPNSSLSLVLIKSILASTLFLDKLLSLNSFRILNTKRKSSDNNSYFESRKKFIDDTDKSVKLQELKKVSPWIPQFTPK